MKIKSCLKHSLSRLGLFSKLDELRRLPDIWRWVAHGCTGPAPPPIKRRTLGSYLVRFNLSEFVETGTHLGDTLAYLACNKALKCTSIELAELYYKSASVRFAKWENISLLHGDSGKLLPDVVTQLSKPALFWLDGHYSGGLTARGDVPTPISAELQAIFDSPIKSHVILIDDARCFNGDDGYPHLDALLAEIRANDHYVAEVSADIIRVTPN